MRAWDGGVETGDGDNRGMETATKKKGNKNQRPVSVPASPRTSGIKRRATARDISHTLTHTQIPTWGRLVSLVGIILVHP